jgi:hypothetical protein
MTGSNPFWTRRMSKPCCAPKAKLCMPHAGVGSRWPFPKAMSCWSAPSPRENRPPAKPLNCSGSWTCTAWPLCAALFEKR